MDKKDLTEIRGIVSEEINKFAIIVAKSFNGVQTRFESIDKRFDSIDRKLAEHDKKFAEHDERFEKIDERFEKIDERFEKIDERFEKIDERFEKIDERFNYHNQKMEQGFNELSIKIDKVVTMLSQDMEPVYEDIDNLKRRVTKLEKARA